MVFRQDVRLEADNGWRPLAEFVASLHDGGVRMSGWRALYPLRGALMAHTSTPVGKRLAAALTQFVNLRRWSDRRRFLRRHRELVSQEAIHALAGPLAIKYAEDDLYGGCLSRLPLPVGFQNSATVLDLCFYAARSYSLMRPPRTGRRWIRS